MGGVINHQRGHVPETREFLIRGVFLIHRIYKAKRT